MTAWLDTLLFRSGPGVAGAEIGTTQIRVRMGSFRLDIPRSSVRAVWRSHADVHGTTGVHGGRGCWLVNGSPDGLVELAIDPPCYLAPGIDTLFRRAKVERLILSLADPDGFIVAAEGYGLTPNRQAQALARGAVAQLQDARELPPSRPAASQDGVVLIDQLNQGMDRIEIEARVPGGRLATRSLGLEPYLRLLGAEPGHGLGHRVATSQVDEAGPCSGLKPPPAGRLRRANSFISRAAPHQGIPPT